MLVIKRDNRSISDRRPQIVNIRVITDDVVTDDLRCRYVWPFGQQPQSKAQRDGGLLHHAGELSTADDGKIGRRSHLTSVVRTSGMPGAG